MRHGNCAPISSSYAATAEEGCNIYSGEASEKGLSSMPLAPCFFSASGNTNYFPQSINGGRCSKQPDVVTLGAVTLKRASNIMTTITPSELHQRLKRGEKLNLIDVRTPAEHGEIHVPEVHLAPLEGLDAAKLAAAKGFAKGEPLFIFCRSGNRSKQAAAKLQKGGYQQCCIVEGGTMAWAQAGLPVNRGASRVISLERQVRIAAGILVLTGVLLTYIVNPAFILLSGFVGAGLTFAGITDWCGMGMIIAKMPWNQHVSSCGAK
jgi:rhodanese-related sulfurtransferase